MANQSVQVPFRLGSSCVSSHFQAIRATTARDYGLASPDSPAFNCRGARDDVSERRHMVSSSCTKFLSALQE